MTASVHRLAPHLTSDCERASGPVGRERAAGASLGFTPEGGRDVLVTRPESPKNGTPTRESAPFFCDWLTIRQVHTAGGLPLVDSGRVWAVDEEGIIEWSTVKRRKVLGSYDTAVFVTCDGFTVTFAGNVSRYGRRDNVFGFDVWGCIERVNAVLATYGLPPFTPGVKREEIKRGSVRTVWTGARISRIDLTANYEAGSSDDAHAVMQYLGTQHVGRKNSRVLAAGETVDWGAGSRRQYWKCYVKHIELIKHGCEDQQLIDHCAARGVVRLEGTLKSNALTDIGAAYLGDYESGWAMGQLINIFGEHRAALTRAEKVTDDLDELPRALRGVARDYLAGMALRDRLSKTTFYRHRNALLPYGIDIAVTNVAPFKPRVRVIELRPAEIPHWYQFNAA